MDTLPTTNSLLSSNSSGSRSSLGAESASVQSHVSVTSFQHRLRSSSYGSDKRRRLDYFLDTEHDQTLWGNSAVRCLSIVGIRSARQQARTYSTIKWTFYLWPILHEARDTSSVETLSMDVLLSKATSIYPAPQSLDPFVLNATIDPSAVTACLWTHAEGLGSVATWAARWTGPISLLLTTTAEPTSPEHKMLLRQLLNLKNKSTLLNTTLSVHVLHLDDGTPENSNAFLNLARMFSQTPRAVLFPGNLTILPPKTLYASLINEHSTSAAVVSPSLTSGRTDQSIVLTTRSQTSFPFSPLAPVVLQRDAPLWCTERSFPAVSREADWEECIWQVWLEHFGDVDVRQTRGWLHDLPLRSTAMSLDSPVMKLRHRLQAKWRGETCVLATRRIAAMKAAERPVDAKKARWLKRTCRPWTSAN